MLRKGRLNYKKEDIANFSHIEQVQIGKNYFSNEDLKEYFGAIGDIADSNKSAIVLLKQVFQTEYPITRLLNCFFNTLIKPRFAWLFNVG